MGKATKSPDESSPSAPPLIDARPGQQGDRSSRRLTRMKSAVAMTSRKRAREVRQFRGVNLARKNPSGWSSSSASHSRLQVRTLVVIRDIVAAAVFGRRTRAVVRAGQRSSSPGCRYATSDHPRSGSWCRLGTPGVRCPTKPIGSRVRVESVLSSTADDITEREFKGRRFGRPNRW